MKKVIIGISIMIILIAVFLIYNHKQVPTKDDVINNTSDWNTSIEEVYLVEKIDGEWLTIFRDENSTMFARLVQNWLGYWEMKDDLGNENTLASIDYPPLQDEFNWTAGSKADKASYYFGHINNPKIKRVEVETKSDFFEEAIIISYEQGRFFFAKSDGELVMPVNIRGYSETGELIHSTIEIRK